MLWNAIQILGMGKNCRVNCSFGLHYGWAVVISSDPSMQTITLVFYNAIAIYCIYYLCISCYRICISISHKCIWIVIVSNIFYIEMHYNILDYIQYIWKYCIWSYIDFFTEDKEVYNTWFYDLGIKVQEHSKSKICYWKFAVDKSVSKSPTHEIMCMYRHVSAWI